MRNTSGTDMFLYLKNFILVSHCHQYRHHRNFSWSIFSFLFYFRNYLYPYLYLYFMFNLYLQYLYFYLLSVFFFWSRVYCPPLSSSQWPPLNLQCVVGSTWYPTSVQRFRRYCLREWVNEWVTGSLTDWLTDRWVDISSDCLIDRNWLADLYLPQWLTD